MRRSSAESQTWAQRAGWCPRAHLGARGTFPPGPRPRPTPPPPPQDAAASVSLSIGSSDRMSVQNLHQPPTEKPARSTMEPSSSRNVLYVRNSSFSAVCDGPSSGYANACLAGGRAGRGRHAECAAARG